MDNEKNKPATPPTGNETKQQPVKTDSPQAETDGKGHPQSLPAQQQKEITTAAVNKKITDVPDKDQEEQEPVKGAVTETQTPVDTAVDQTKTETEKTAI